MQEQASPQPFVQRRLPWILAGIMGLIYLITLSRWITFGGLSTQAQILGWNWQPMLYAPLYYVLTFPIRWLPAAWQITGLNLFSAVCSAIALGLLARSVVLLPHDRTRDQRDVEQSDYSFLSIRAAWVPPLLAVLVCGLQLTLWENSVMASGEALDLLLFAYLIWELLEFRVDQREMRLLRWAMVYGVGITNNFALIGFAPAFLVALIWIRGLDFFNLGFLVRMAICGLAGLSWYLLLPLIHTIAGSTDQSFLELLKANIGGQKMALLGFPRFILLLVGLTSIFPVFFMGIKWPANFGDVSPIGTALTNLMTHIIHGVFLLACLYVAFDPAFSPRQLGGGIYPMLPLYYLGALSVGYFTGYFLLVFGSGRYGPTFRRDPAAWRKAVHATLGGLVWILLAAVPIGLLVQNYPKIQSSTAKHLSRMGSLSVESLPAQGAVVLSDDPTRMYSVKAALNERGTADKYLLLDTSALPYPGYHRVLRQRYGQRWPAGYDQRAANQIISPAGLVELLKQLGRTQVLYYLHPSFGYYFEHFYQIPENSVYRLAEYPPNVIEAPLPTAEQFQANDAYWQQLRSTELPPIIEAVKRQDPKKQKAEVVWPGMMYGRAVDLLGVLHQQAGHLPKAAEYFALALELNPESPVAYINLAYNKQLQAGKPENFLPDEGAAKRLGPYRKDFSQILALNGPFEEPNSCYLLGQSLTGGGNYRQGAQQMLRTLHYDKDHLPARLGLAGALLHANLTEKALGVVEETRAWMAKRPADTNDQIALLQVEAWALARNNDMPTAEKLLTAAQEKYPENPVPFLVAADIYLAMGRITNAMTVIQKQLQTQPEDANALANYAALKIRAGQLTEALPYLNRALKAQPRHPYALLNRAIVYLQTGKVDEAERDYTTLERLLPQPSYAVYYGLGETARLKKNQKEALKYYERFLKLAPPGTPEINDVTKHIKSLESGT